MISKAIFPTPYYTGIVIDPYVLQPLLNMNLDIKPGGRLEKQTSQVTIDAPACLEKQTPQINIDAPAFLPKAIIRALVIYVLWTTQMLQVPIQLSFM